MDAINARLSVQKIVNLANRASANYAIKAMHC